MKTRPAVRLDDTPVALDEDSRPVLDSPSVIARGRCLFWTADPCQGDALRDVDIPACSPTVPHGHPEYRDDNGEFIKLARNLDRTPVAIVDRAAPVPPNIPSGVARVVRIDVDRVVESRTVLAYISPKQNRVHAPTPVLKRRRRAQRFVLKTPSDTPPCEPSAAQIASVRVAPTCIAALDAIITACEVLPPPRQRQESDIIQSRSSNINAADWINADPPQPDHIIEQLFDRGDKVAFIGASKSRKTFFSLQLALSLAAGLRTFLGWNIPRARRVLMVQLEVAPQHFHRRFRRMVDAIHVSAAELGDRLRFLNGRGAIPTFAEIQSAALEHRADVIIIDPFYKVSQGDENASADVKLTLAEFDRLAEATRASVLFVHHEKKGAPGDRDARDRGAGSGVLARDFDAGLFIADHRDDNDAGSLFVLRTVLRNYPPRAQFSIRFEAGRFDVAIGVAPVERTSKSAWKQANRLPDMTALMAFQRGALSASDMWAELENLGFTNKAARRAVARLLVSETLAVHTTHTVPPKRMHGLPDQIEALKRAESASADRHV